jgi:ATP-dependent Clp protease protease subunit
MAGMNRKILAALVAVPLSATALHALLDNVDHTTVEPDYEEMWDLLADSGNQVPHVSNDDALIRSRTIVLARDVNANSAHHLITALLRLDREAPGKPIDLYLRTNGGWNDDLFAIISVIESLKSPVNTIATGSTYSAGATILASGTGVRRALPNTLIMVHDNLEVDAEPGSFDRLDADRGVAFWKRRAKLPKSWFTESGDESRYLTAEQALEYGIIDEIVEPLER